MAGAYALDALDREERAAFEEHLADCSECTLEVRSMQDAAAELSHISTVAPPAALRADVLGAISRVRPLPPITDNVIALRRARVGRSLWQVMAAACALIAIIAAGWGYQQHQDAGKRATASASSVDSVLSAQDAIATSGDVAGGHATIVLSKSQHRAVLVAHSLASPGKGKTYQLWLMSAGGTKIVSAGTFSPDSSGNARATASADLSNTSQMGISIEPAGGSAQPTHVIAAMNV
jgi:anti-sigma-K factor RskA